MVDKKLEFLLKEFRQSFLERIAPFLILALATFFLDGCNGLHLHNPADEALARKANDAFKAADVGVFIDSEREMLAAAKERDLTVIRRNILAERDAKIIMALSEGRVVQTLLDRIKGRLAKIGIPDDSAKRKMLYNLESEREDAMVALDTYLAAKSMFNNQLPSFPPSDADETFATNSGNDNVHFQFSSYKDLANRYLKNLGVLQNQKEGLIGELNEKIAKGNEFKGNLSKEIAKRKDALKGLVEKYKEEAKDTTKNVEPLRAKIETALENFDKVAEDFEPVAKKLGLEDFLAETQLEKLKEARNQVGKFLSAFAQENSAESQTPSETSESSRSEADLAGRAAALLVKATKDIQDSSTRAKLVPLVFEQGRIKLETERAQRAIDRGQQRLALLEGQRAALITEGMKLIDTVNTLEKLSNVALDNEVKALREKFKTDPNAAQNATKEMQAILADPGLTQDNTKKAKKHLLATREVKSFLADPNAKEQVVHALFLWAESIAIDQLRQEQIEVALISLDHEQAMDASEFALDLWQHMIASPLEELVAYHASGLKSEDIANLIHAAGLAGIAVGVNR